MLAPLCELETGEEEIFDLGVLSLERWPEFLTLLDESVFFQRAGTLVVSPPSDRAELELFARRLAGRARPPTELQELRAPELARLEPELGGRFSRGFHVGGEGQIDNRQLLTALRNTLEARGVDWRTGREVAQVRPGRVILADGFEEAFDAVADCRGLGSKAELDGLRGVRGELMRVDAPEVDLHRPIRLMHPRFPVYVVPRPEGKYLIGATSVESEDFSPISVQSTVELLGAAFVVHPGFAEARVLESVVNCRPCFPDHRPRLYYRDGLVRLNGLYRHGYLVSPILALAARKFLIDGSVPEEAASVAISG